MTKEEKEMWDIWMQQQQNQGCGTTFVFAAILFILVAFTSCRTITKIEYRDRDVNHYITNTVHDTLRIKESDSVHHEIRIANDTVYDTKYVEHTRWRDKIIEKHDTCWRDSIVNNTKTEKVEKKYVPKIYTYCFVLSILVLIFATIRVYKSICDKFRKL